MGIIDKAHSKNEHDYAHSRHPPDTNLSTSKFTSSSKPNKGLISNE